MPYYLNNASSASAGINIPSVVIGATVGDYIEIKAVANSGNPSNNYRVAGQQSGFSNFIEIRPASAAIACGGSSVTFTTGYTQPAVGSIFTIRFTRASSTTWRCTLNGSVLGSDLTNASNCTLDAFFRFASSTTEAFRGGIYYVAISTNGGASATRYYDPSASGGTGTVLPDTVNSANNGNQVGTWPANDSEWVFYSSGASNTLSVSATLPKITGSLTLNEINPSYVISVSGQLPKITGAVALNEINPVFTVAVAGQLPKLTGSISLNRLQPSRQAAVNGTLPKIIGSIALNQFGAVRQAAVSGVLPKLTGAVTLNRIQPNNQAAVSGQLPRITASITLRVPESYPAANPNDYTVSAYVSTDSTYTARLIESSTINAIISTETTYTARLN